MKLKKKIKLIIPSILLISSLGGFLGYIFSSSGQSIFRNYASLEAGYDQDFSVPILKNAYRHFNSDSYGNFAIISQPNLQAIQSLDLKKDQINVKPNISNFAEFEIQKTSLENKKLNQNVVFYADMTEKQFKNLLDFRYLADLGLLFNVNIKGFDSNLNNFKTIEFKNLITGFAFNDLSLAKEKTYPIFDYVVNDDFANLIGNIKGFLDIKMAPNGVFSLKVRVQTNSIIANNLNTDPKKNKLKIEFLPIDSDVYFKPILFWDNNQNNDLDQWFWPLPTGPVQDPKVVTTKEDNKIIDSKQYSTTYKAFKNNANYFSFPYSKVSNFDKYKKPADEKEENVVKIVFDQDKWQKNFFNNWDSKIPNNPGIKIQFNFELSVLAAQYGQIQKYNASVFAFFQFDKLLNGSTFNQDFVNYNLGLGRINNAGKIKLSAKAKINLSNQLVISLSAYGSDLIYIDPKEPNEIKPNQYKSDFKFSHVEVSAFYDSKSKKVDKNKIKPIKTYIKNVRNANKNAISPQIKDVPRETDRLGRQRHKDAWEAYMFDYKTVWSSWSSESLKSYTESNSKFVNRTYLTFNFMGSSLTNNKTNINLRSPGNLNQLIYYNPGIHYNDRNSVISSKEIVQKANKSDNFNTFSIPFRVLDKNVKKYTWKQMVTFDKKNYGISGFNNNLFNFDYNKYKHNENYSAMRAQFIIELKKTADFTFSYRLGTTINAYQWNSGSTSASNGRAGFILDSIKIEIK